jgi:hypothetical protein
VSPSGSWWGERRVPSRPSRPASGAPGRPSSLRFRHFLRSSRDQLPMSQDGVREKSRSQTRAMRATFAEARRRPAGLKAKRLPPQAIL